MSAASYRRGSQIIREQIDREMKRPRSATERAYAAGLDHGRREAEAEIATLLAKIEKHRAHAERLRIYLAAERQRIPAVLERLRAFRDSFRGTGVSGQHWAAIVAYKRALEAA